MKEQEDFISDLPSKSKYNILVEKCNNDDDIRAYLNNRLDNDPNNIKPIIDGLDKIFIEIPAISHPLIVYRGSAKKYWKLEGFSSTSLDIDIAYSYADDCIFRIIIPANSKVIPMYSLGNILEIFNEEKEILLNRDGITEMINTNMLQEYKTIPLIDIIYKR